MKVFLGKAIALHNWALHKYGMILWIFLCAFAPLRETFIPKFSNAHN